MGDVDFHKLWKSLLVFHSPVEGMTRKQADFGPYERRENKLLRGRTGLRELRFYFRYLCGV
jgi:hypothetical protein